MRVGILALAAGSLACGRPPGAPNGVAPSTTALASPSPASLARPAPGRLPRDVVPARYRVHWRIDPREESFTGEVAIDVRVMAGTDRIHLHARELALDGVVEQGGRRQQVLVEAAQDPRAEPAAGERMLRLAAPLRTGTARIQLRFRGRFDRRLAGLYRARSGSRWFAYTQFEAADARKAFPCFDEPGFKVPFEVTVSVPRGMTAVSNTAEASRRTRGSWDEIAFAPSRPMPTYLVAFVAGELELVAGPAGPVPIRGVVPPGRGAEVVIGLGMARELLPRLEAYFGLPYPYGKLDLAFLVEFASGAMENPGLVTFREEALLVDPRATSVARLRRVAGTIAHELAHQWFGNLVTLAWWDDLWLNEAFATWMGVRTVEAWRPSYRAADEFLEWRGWVFDTDTLAAARPVRQTIRSVVEAEGAFDGITYGKGAAVLGMLEQWLGSGTFQRAVQGYMCRHMWENATAKDLFAALDRESGREVGAVASSFLDRPGVPEVNATLRCEKGRAEVRLEQRRHRPLGAWIPEGFPGGEPWKIPVCVMYPAGERLTTQCVLLDRAVSVVPLKEARACPAWIHPNAGEKGYYRWGLAEGALVALARHGRRFLSPALRGSILNHAAAMVSAGSLRPAALLDTVAAFEGDSARAVVEEQLGVLRRIRERYRDGGPDPAYAAYVRRVLEAQGRRLGLAPRRGESEDDAILRPAVLRALARDGRSAWVLDGVRAMAQGHLRGARPLPPDLLPMVLEVAAAEGHLPLEELTRRLGVAVSSTERAAVLGALGSLPQGSALDQALSLVLTDQVKVQDMWYLLSPPFERAESRSQAMRFVQRNLRGLVGRLPAFGGRSAARLPGVVGYLCSEADSATAARFFRTQAVPGSERILRQGLERSAQCAAQRAWGRAAVKAYLERLASLEPSPRPSEKGNAGPTDPAHRDP
ncbi:MAG: ERAP1-like C-terminal domain-containing protein [Deltaproteobacteria bacterium]|nr:ERAP1-like C-terminal domain-containing protein [Deltaproteobacteria bacterium]